MGQRELVENEGAPRMKVRKSKAPSARPPSAEERRLLERVQGTKPENLLRRIKRLELRVQELEAWKRQHEFDHSK